MLGERNRDGEEWGKVIFYQPEPMNEGERTDTFVKGFFRNLMEDDYYNVAIFDCETDEECMMMEIEEAEYDLGDF